MTTHTPIPTPQRPAPPRTPTRRPNSVLDDAHNTTLTAGLLLIFGLAYLACWLHLGPHTLAWTLNRATGTVAYLLLAATTATGALLGSRYSPAWLTRAQQAGWHGVTSGFALTLGMVHGLLLTVDATYPQSLLAVLIPGASSVRPLPVALGTLGAYLLALVIVSTRARRHLNPRVWKALHLSAYPAFALLTAHGVTAGSDHLGALYATSVAAVAFTFGLRLLEETKKRRPPRSTG
ncbi:ferric reductase-like transmembrane domain-containing protein [Deinococcus aquaticus]|uniref:Ferric reductase-like transmembrane domain-containing protein n=1 Tax=Deinococcus aquaticus TaxID=328692 RepID=A0ABY7V1Z8_9DEIO|nr:ferric reductase-like transmembrane domain-containing protein [Deinococcus aquaticus]WDA59145.1 ferric reductase-like transmembrane domain-containing protein [Deinococcus aquaticus]